MQFIRLDYVLLRSLVTLVVVLAVTLSSWWPEASVSSAAEIPLGATLKVLALPVEVQPAQTDTFIAASDGQMLNQGDVIRTGPGGLALLTFFDGSESQLGADSRVLIERAEATPAPQIALLQTAGVTMNHVVPMPPGGSFQTDTPAATGLVRGTSYVVVVGEGASQSSDERTASQTVFTCGQTGDRSCATSVILLTDRDGHVGRVDVAAPGSSAVAPIHLSKAGDAAASDAGQTSAARLAAPHLQALEAGANARELPEAARDAEHHAHVVAAALVRLTAPATNKPSGNADTDDALEPAPPAKGRTEHTATRDEPAGRAEETGHAVHGHTNAVEPHHVAPPSMPAAVVAEPGASDKKQDIEEPGASAVSSPLAPVRPAVAPPVTHPGAPISHTVPAPVVAVPAPVVAVPAPVVAVPASSGANEDKGKNTAKP